jgi:hypothetical protein
MGYRKGYSNSYYNSAATEHVAQFNELNRKLGPVVSDIKSEFFSLSVEDFDDLVSRYSALHGLSAANYVLEAYPRWESGATKMSGQTMGRLLDLVPKYVSYDSRYNMVKRLCAHHRKKKSETIRIDKDKPLEGLRQLDAAIDSFYDHQNLLGLPDHVIETLNWLNDDDLVAARALLAQVENEEANRVQDIVRRNRGHIRDLIENKEIKSFEEVISFPNGDLRVYSFKESFCIIATSVYGSSEHADVLLLRQFRDQYLLDTSFGRYLVSCYYNNGHHFASALKDSNVRKRCVKGIFKIFLSVYGVFIHERR